MRLLALALLLGGAAEAQVIPPGGAFDWATYSPGGVIASPIVFSFAAPAAGYYAPLTPTVGNPVSCSRPSSGTYLDGSGVRQTAPANTCRVENAGLLIEGPSQNNLLNSNAPVTQTTASLGTGNYTGWVEGTGSLAFAVGTAVATGLPCTATTGVANDCHFNITTAGTVVATVTGSLTLEQLEPQPFRTSYIATTGTVASRSGDVVSFTKPAGVIIAGGSYSASVTAALTGLEFTGQVALSSDQNFAPYLRLAVGPSSNVDAASDATAALSSIARSDALKKTSTKYALSKSGTTVTVYAAGVAGTPATTSTQTAEPTTIYLGGGSGNPLFGNISAACIAKTATGCAP